MNLYSVELVDAQGHKRRWLLRGARTAEHARACSETLCRIIAANAQAGHHADPGLAIQQITRAQDDHGHKPPGRPINLST